MGTRSSVAVGSTSTGSINYRSKMFQKIILVLNMYRLFLSLFSISVALILY
jgi:hypothetical protein